MCASTEYFLENYALSNRKSFPLGRGGGRGGLVAISDVLLEGGLTFKTYLDKEGGGGR